MNINNINVNKYPVSQVFDPESKVVFEIPKYQREYANGQYIGYRNGLNLNDDVCDKDEWTVEMIKQRTDRMVKEIMAMFAL